MKRVIVLLAALFTGMITASAAEKITAEDSKDLRITKRYRYTQPILFVERGVEFLIFPNGQFDFNTEIVGGPFVDDFYYRGSRSRRNSINSTFGAPGRRYFHSGPGGVLILHDRFGQVRRIGNVFINYDSRGRVKRIGSVYMRYRHGRLKQVGGLTILYNRWGHMIGTRGHVNHSNLGCGVCGVTGCTADHFQLDQQWGSNDWDDWDDDWDDFDDDYYYYRHKGKKIKRKKFKRFKDDD